MANIDFYFRNAISFTLLMPISNRAEQWVTKNIKLESWQDRNEIAIEPRMFEDIYEGLINSGMIVKTSS
jgi:hypothetical protein